VKSQSVKLGPITLWPASLAGRTALLLAAALTLVQVAGLTIDAFDRIGLQRLAQTRDVSLRLMALYHSVQLTPEAQREAAVHDLDLRDGSSARATDDVFRPVAGRGRSVSINLTAMF